jgi:exodeoxyribonuclease V
VAVSGGLKSPARSGCVLSAEQLAAAETLLAGVEREQVQTLGGYAGTGKTTLVRFLAERLDAFGVCAFTGKAADVLRRKGIPATTIHSLIYTPTLNGGFVLKSPESLGVRGFIVDEASMVGRDILRDLKSFGLPVLAVGDHGQLPPVGEDAGLMRNPDVRLETIHRNAGPIARFAEHLRKGGTPAEWKRKHANGRGVYVVGRGSVGTGSLVAADQIICAFNRTRVGLNRSVRRFVGRPGDEPVVGDRIMCLQNDRTAGVFNGQQGTLEGIDPERLELRFLPTHGDSLKAGYHPDSWNAEKAPKREQGVQPGTMIPFDFAYAVTAHKAQGDEWDKVIVYEERCDLWEHSRWAYTAASRAKENLVWVTG